MKKLSRVFVLIAYVLSLHFSGVALPANAAGTTTVTPNALNNWWFAQETPTGSGTFTYGPATPPLGGGSAQFTINGTGGEILGTFAYVGTHLDAITSLAYSTYRTSGSTALAPSLQLDIDTNVTDANTAWQGRLVYEPYFTHTVTTGVWQTWNPQDNFGTGNWWFTGAPGNASCPLSNPCTWAQVRTAFPNAGIRSAGANTGALQFKAGGGWASGFVGSVDAFQIGIAGDITSYDFELPYPVPTLTSISPLTKQTTDSGFTLNVTGTNFVAASTIQWNGSNRATTYVSPTQLSAAIPATDLSLVGSVSVAVVNPTPEGGASNAQTFAVTLPTSTTDFETFNLGEVQNQNGWTSGHGSSVCPLYDVAVVTNTYGIARFGTQSLRISNAITCGSFNDQTLSKSLTNEAGETAASVSAFSGGVRQPYFEAQWDFASALPGSEQVGLSVVASPNRGDTARMSWLQMQDTPTGLQLNFQDYQRAVANFVTTPIATGLDRTLPHTVRMTIEFIDGPSNDIVKIYLDGALIHTGTSWEDYFRDFGGGSTNAVDSIMFREAGTAAPALSGKGLLIDNFSSLSGPVPTIAAPPAPSGGSHEGTITVVKVVVNDSDGTKTLEDFPLFVNERSVVSGVGNNFPAPAGVYTVTETNIAGYTHSFSGDCDASGQLTLNPNETRFCIITNDDIGTPKFVPAVPPLIDVVKVPSPLSLPGGPGPVTYTYTLRNIGTVPVTNISMVGDSCSPITLLSGDVNNDAVLDVSETWVYRCATTLAQTHTNTIVATGWSQGLITSDIASATVVVGAPGLPDTGLTPPLIHVTKIPSPLTLVAGGGLVTYTETVTNPGVAPLSNVRLTDDTCSPMQYISGDTNGDKQLAADESWTYTCRTNLIKTTANTAIASGEANGFTVRDFAIALVIVADVVPKFPNTGFAPYNANEERAAAPTVDIDKNLVSSNSNQVPACDPAHMLKLENDGDPGTQSDSTVYACGSDGKRYVFPDVGTYSSWYADFSGVRIASASLLASLPLGGNVTYRPGSRLLKIESDPKVYAVSKGGVLRWVTDEATARALYGSNWSKNVVDVPVSIFNSGYVIGDPIASTEVTQGAFATACTRGAIFSKDIRFGSSDSEVRPLQELLQCLGYFPTDVPASGYYGAITRAAVQKFQSANGIASGDVNATTRDALNQYPLR